MMKKLLYIGNKLSTKGFVALHDARIFENGWTKLDWGPVRLMNEIINIIEVSHIEKIKIYKFNHDQKS